MINFFSYHNACGHQICQGGGIPQRASTHKFSWNIYEVVLKSRDK